MPRVQFCKKNKATKNETLFPLKIGPYVLDWKHQRFWQCVSCKSCQTKINTSLVGSTSKAWLLKRWKTWCERWFMSHHRFLFSVTLLLTLRIGRSVSTRPVVLLVFVMNKAPYIFFSSWVFLTQTDCKAQWPWWRHTEMYWHRCLLCPTRTPPLVPG